MPQTIAPPVGRAALLRIPGMRAMFVAHAVSMVGTLAAEVALSILIYQRTGSALLSALVLVCSFLPYAVGGTVLSSLADRFPARTLLVCCDLLSACCIAAMLIPGMPVAALLGLLLVTGFIAPVFTGARSASLAQLLDGDTFPVGRSMLRTISQTAVVTGFAAGSVAVAVIGPRWMLAADVVSFLGSAALIGLCTPATPAGTPDGGHSVRAVVRDSTAGLRHIFTNRRLRRLILLSWAVPAFSSVGDGLAVAYTAQTGSAATAAGALFTGYAAGTVVGELSVNALSPPTRRRLVVPLVVASQLPLTFFLAEPSVLVASLLLAVSGAGFAFNQGIDPLILKASEPAYHGRLFTVQSGGLMAAQGVGIALSGAIGTFVEPGLVISLAGLLGLLVICPLARGALKQQSTSARPGPVQ